jgi:hypothetical protein
MLVFEHCCARGRARSKKSLMIRAAQAPARIELTPPELRRTRICTMSSGFEAAFAAVKVLVADFRANEKYYLSSAYQEQEVKVVVEIEEIGRSRYRKHNK